ncbi:MAG: SufD family Fe-S cluster assembly protein [Pseudomonadota bacterium]
MALAQQKSDGAAALLARHAAPGGASRWADEARAAARARLETLGAPVRRDEYWKFTNPSLLTAEAPQPTAAFDDGEPRPFSDIDALRITFVDGAFRADLSDDLTGQGVEIELLTDALGADIHWAKDMFGVLEAAGQSPVARPLAALNTAVARSGCVIRATGEVARPVNLRYLHESETSDAVIRHVVRIDSGASLTVLENGPAAARFNKVMEVDVADTGTFHHVRAQGRDHERQCVSHMFTRLGQESTYKSFTLTVNGVLTRNEQVVEFTGDDAIAHVAGACVGDGTNFHHDDTVFVTHDAERCESRQVFKKVLRNGATGVFQGKILVKEGAQKTDGYQISQGLLLDEDSQFLAKPELEIYADDVVCSHGSTCGAVDETALFYLLSRGVPKDAAQNMLVLAFIDEAVQEIEDEDLAEDIRGRIGAWLDRRKA